MDSADSYLRRAAQIRKKIFGSSGFLCAEPGPPALCLNKSFKPESNQGSASKKRSRSPSCSDDCPMLPASPLSLGDQVPQSQRVGAADSEVSRSTRRISLMEKCFPRNALKVEAIGHSNAPSQDYVEGTMARIIEIREKMLLLRNGAEDIESALKSFGISKITGENLPVEVLRHMRLLIDQFALQRSNSLHSSKMQLLEYLRIRRSISVPLGVNALMWHEFLNQKGPETPFFPITSFFVFPSSASLTLLFTILTQRLQKQYHLAKEKAMSHLKGDILSSEGVFAKNSNDSATIKFSCLNPNLSESQQNLLIFLRLFMPTVLLHEHETSACLRSSGYFMWLLACLTVLDTPLDPDTDRLASSLFHLCCAQVRAIGEVKGVEGDQRGALADALKNETGRCHTYRKQYDSIDDVGLEELLGLHTIIIVLSKIFRQNQNKIIFLG